MATAYPGALDTTGSQQRTDIASTDDMDASGKEHDVMHVNHAGAIVALETKLGLTDSNAAANAILVGSGTSTTSWTTSPTVSGTLTATTGIVAPLQVNNETSSYTLVLADAGKMVEMNSGSANNLTIPPNSSVAFPTGTQIIITQQGAGATTIVEGSGVTTRSLDDNAIINGQYVSVALVKRATDEWYIFGNLTS